AYAMEPLEIAPGRHIGEGLPCFIVAEIGQNHQGDIEIAKTLIRQAKECGADCVKIQKSCLSAKFTASALARPYDSEHSFGETYGEHKANLEFSPDEVKVLQEYATEIGLPLTASAMDISTCYLRMCDIAWVSEMYRDLSNHAPATPIVLLQCTSAYPTPSAHVHLRVMDTYAQMFPHAHIGYSGHELGIHISVAAVLERHLTLNKGWKGSDHACSLEPHEFRQLVNAIRNVESALGSPLKAMQPSEDVCYRKLGKSVVTARDLSAGEELHEDDLVAKVCEPPGLPAQVLYTLVGRRLKRNISSNIPLSEDDLLT
ncbi:Sialic acid synthase, partial [Armadillidium nasatum]